MKKVFGISGLIVADGEDFYRSSELPLQVDQAPRIIELWLPNVPGGEYAVYAALRDASGHERAVTRESATVLPQFGY